MRRYNVVNAGDRDAATEVQTINSFCHKTLQWSDPEIIYPTSSYNTKYNKTIQNLVHTIKCWCCWYSYKRMQKELHQNVAWLERFSSSSTTYNCVFVVRTFCTNSNITGVLRLIECFRYILEYSWKYVFSCKFLEKIAKNQKKNVKKRLRIN